MNTGTFEILEYGFSKMLKLKLHNTLERKLRRYCWYTCQKSNRMCMFDFFFVSVLLCATFTVIFTLSNFCSLPSCMQSLCGFSSGYTKHAVEYSSRTRMYIKQIKGLNEEADNISVFLNLKFLRLKLLKNMEIYKKMCNIFHRNFKVIPCCVASRFCFVLYDNGLVLKTLNLACIGFFIQAFQMLLQQQNLSTLSKCYHCIFKNHKEMFLIIIISGEFCYVIRSGNLYTHVHIIRK